MDFPTIDNIHEWDNASLFAMTGMQAALREGQGGFESLNDAESVMCCLFVFDGDVNNGGFGKWLYDLSPRTLEATLPSLRSVGAVEMAKFVEEIIAPFGDLNRFTDREAWREYFSSLPDAFHEQLETRSSRFVELEKDFLECAYVYARAHWKNVREY